MDHSDPPTNTPVRETGRGTPKGEARGWYGFVALVFSFHKPRASYMKSKAIFDRSAAGVMGLLELRVIADIR